MIPFAQRVASQRLLRTLVFVLAIGCGMAFGLHRAGSAAADHRVSLSIVDAAGKPVEQAILWALPVSGQVVPSAAGSTAEIEQRDKRFDPGVLPVQVGTPVSFPNHDTVRHQVYSFSPPKVFSLKLYIGTPADPIVFDKPGEVVLGCNIHDRMLAYVLALETPYFGKTGAEGRVELAGLVVGEYELRAWYPGQKSAVASQRVRVDGQPGKPTTHRFVVGAAG